MKSPFNALLFAKALKSFRDQAKKTLEQVSEETGVSTSTICRIENGRTSHIDHVVILCGWMGRKITDFITSEEGAS